MFKQKKIESSDDKISTSDVGGFVSLANQTKGSLERKVSLLILDNGKSGGVSPRNTIYLTYKSIAELGNMDASFLLSERVIEFQSATRVEAGIYKVETVELSGDAEEIMKVTRTISIKKMLEDEKNETKKCSSEGSNCNIKFNTSIEVTDKVESAN